MYIIAVFLAAVLIPARMSAADKRSDGDQDVTSTAASETRSYVLGANDRIVVRCINAEELPPTPIRIDNDGQVTLPFIGRVKLAGLSIGDAENLLADQLAKYIRNPQVQVILAEGRSQPVSVLGAVHNPGEYQLEGHKTLTQILSMAGGLRPDAGRVLKLTRRADRGSIPVPDSLPVGAGGVSVAEINVEALVRGNNPSQDVEVQPYDVISIPAADLVYVVGEVHKPGGFAMTGRNEFSVLQAVSMAEGLQRTAAPKSARILRKTANSGRVEIPVNLANILSGRAPDVNLQADDVLFVPNNAAKSAGMKTLDTIIQTTTGMAIYGRY